MSEESRKNYWIVDLLGAIVCGYAIGAFQQNAADSGEYIFENFVHCVVLAIGSYSVTALLIPIWKARPLRRIPNWVLIVVLGSAIYYFCIHLVDTVTYDLRFRYTHPELSATQYVLSNVWEFGVDLLIASIIDSLLALPIMWAVHFLGNKLMRTARS